MSFNPFAVTAARTNVSAKSAIALASQKTGVDFSYLMGQAQLESGMRSDARAGTSSASGLYQFIDQSWLRVMKQHGAEHGMAWASDAISSTGSGRMTVSDPRHAPRDHGAPQRSAGRVADGGRTCIGQ
nr:hypothetical protein [Sphingomonas aliaeris]